MTNPVNLDEDFLSLKKYLADKFIDLGDITVCGNITDATVEQECAARVLAWLRSKKKTIEWCSKNYCYPAPKGYKTKKGIWVPSPKEACDNHVDPYKPIQDEDGTISPYRHPYAWWDHCKKYDHCLFLAVHKPYYLLSLVGNREFFFSTVAALMMDKVVPMMINLKDELSKDFLASWCSNQVPGPK